MKPGARGTAKRSSYNTFVTIICFSVGLLGGYLILGSPRTADHIEAINADSRLGHGSHGSVKKVWGTRRELLTPKKASSGISSSSSTMGHGSIGGSLGDSVRGSLQGALGLKAPANGAANGGVPKEMAAALKQQQSDTSEQRVMTAKEDAAKEMAAALKQQQSDKSESAALTSKATEGKDKEALMKGVFPDANTWPITPVKEKMPGNTIHTLFTSNGSPYQNIQARIMVGTYHMVRKMPGGERLVALTRILHRTAPDEVMDEIPTFLAKPLQPECDKWCWFPVADRANAVQQWINAAEKDPSMVKAPWLLLLETDYVWVRPVPDPGDAYDRAVPGWSFGFDYIAPAIPIIIQLLKERCPDCDPKNVPNSGPAPVLARFSDFKAATPIWEELSLWIETHEEAKKMLGWVREMYAWDIGVAANKLNIRNLGPPASPLISQPPHDRSLGNASMYHYTWGTIYKKPGVEKEIWMFDKRTYTAYEHQLKLPPIPMPPNWTEDLTLQDGLKVTKELHDTVVDMLSHMNQAIAQLPDLTEKVKKQKEAEAAAAAAAAAAAGTKTT
ncbi:hypothetical protein VOLCADRAFT_88948 [Volvox carteri f. nagariensis]|uniref:Hydroxyproline O-arabinosyltransferase-like domain-containing protein n=1 Tax=Volvox carteri f. nagariensis TaxID=3068 RepID=D8TQD9_VOLCA|nr:uncharacterized protein VOLCADRAFT_88948 [Volvox carteri f. nagariensis]EFJ50516.1 hypothetical protein VOLCADRAFT_88948 [Volvox carteri f. nagariensis]|eukprot:XP_002948641.1 hypothetical protein VOLCADRAFT_88948 [Volvox carteri f. nagariensis]